MAIELSRENRNERTKGVIARLLCVVVQGFVQIKMQGDELVGTEVFAAGMKGSKCFYIH